MYIRVTILGDECGVCYEESHVWDSISTAEETAMLTHLITSDARVKTIACVCVLAFNTLRPRQNGRRFADDTFKRIFLNENARISIKISLKFVPNGPINNIPALV